MEKKPRPSEVENTRSSFMGESTLSVGIVGCGIGREHAKAYVEIPDLYEIKAFCDIDEAKADKLASDAAAAATVRTLRPRHSRR